MITPLNLRAFSLSLLLATRLLSPAAYAAAPPNVVILFTDDQGTLDAGCYGSDYLSTLNIDRFAATGTRFTQAEPKGTGIIRLLQ